MVVAIIVDSCRGGSMDKFHHEEEFKTRKGENNHRQSRRYKSSSSSEEDFKPRRHDDIENKYHRRSMSRFRSRDKERFL